ncbi:MAG: MarR family transcriptional regulator [Hyphomicrobiales bacterium]|uniref:MarR family winged helix-turn-helix transcriptional regulator n=1 Tax=Rhabdaerophilum calidifontis TaxID=2604328 RepID=UPI001408486C|nr:MarR family transcriptional regulator [Rhabdaerophilum calidifontis]MCA1952810.1 MarR family transcriptional regulator [Hyphomicrobiales bacterium]MCA1999443.1 MarR family transcriptional regulator [Hyphomicrobiales bacterium]
MTDLPWNRPRFKNWLAVARTSALWHQRLAADIAPLGLRMNQFDIMANLLYEPGMTQQRLAEKIFVGRSNLSMSLPDMEATGWVRREPDAEDRRVKRLFLTPEGESVARLALEAECRLLDEMMEALSETECNQLGDYMRRIGDRLRAGAAAANDAAR